MSSKNRLFVILIDLLDLGRPGILPGIFMALRKPAMFERKIELNRRILSNRPVTTSHNL
jgi:hypothetical protein